MCPMIPGDPAIDSEDLVTNHEVVDCSLGLVEDDYEWFGIGRKSPGCEL